LYKQKLESFETLEFNGCEFRTKLLTQKEAYNLGDKELSEQIADCVYEGDKTLSELGKSEVIENMPLLHKKELMNLIMLTNGIAVEFKDVKKN
jgi:hypothetical protein